jgi:hypothetical protein
LLRLPRENSEKFVNEPTLTIAPQSNQFSPRCLSFLPYPNPERGDVVRVVFVREL